MCCDFDMFVNVFCFKVPVTFEHVVRNHQFYAICCSFTNKQSFLELADIQKKPSEYIEKKNSEYVHVFLPVF